MVLLLLRLRSRRSAGSLLLLLAQLVVEVLGLVVVVVLGLVVVTALLC